MIKKPLESVSNVRSHIGWERDVPAGQGADLVSDGAQNGSVAVLELGVVRVGRVPVEGGVLRLEQRQETTTDQRLAVQGGTQMMGRVAAGGHVRNVEEGSESVLQDELVTNKDA